MLACLEVGESPPSIGGFTQFRCRPAHFLVSPPNPAVRQQRWSMLEGASLANQMPEPFVGSLIAE
jgi:hypothetical protein